MKYKFYTDNKSKVYCITHFAKKPVKGIATCSPKDTFNYEVGAEIAKAKCDYNWSLKRVKRAQAKFYEAQGKLREASIQYDRMKKYWEDTVAESDQYNKILIDVMSKVED